MKKARNIKGTQQKRSKTVAITLGQDRISCLPNTVLCHILSFLPTTNAVASSILSSRWRYVWTSLHTLVFDATLSIRECNFTDAKMERFERFVTSVLLRTDPAILLKFSLLSFRVSASNRLKPWISSAVIRAVRELELKVEYQQRLELPESLYTCVSLEVLKLDSDFDINVPAGVMCFPNVKFLRVSLKYPENHLTEKLFCSCPSLEDLCITVYMKYDGPATNFIISSSTLKRFYWTALVEDFYFYFEICEHKCLIKAPVLELLHIVDDLRVSYEVHELHFIQAVNLEIAFAEWSVWSPHQPLQLLNGVLNTKCLTLSAGIILALDRADVSVLPSFPQLTHLEVKVGETGWRVIPVLLTAVAQLETLVIEKQCWFDLSDDQFRWMENGSVPHSFSEHVKEIEIKGVEDEEDDVNLVQFFLKQCSVLKKMTIRCKGTVSTKQAHHLHHKIARLQRGSVMTEIMLC